MKELKDSTLLKSALKNCAHEYEIKPGLIGKLNPRDVCLSALDYINELEKSYKTLSDNNQSLSEAYRDLQNDYDKLQATINEDQLNIVLEENKQLKSQLADLSEQLSDQRELTDKQSSRITDLRKSYKDLASFNDVLNTKLDAANVQNQIQNIKPSGSQEYIPSKEPDIKVQSYMDIPTLTNFEEIETEPKVEKYCEGCDFHACELCAKNAERLKL